MTACMSGCALVEPFMYQIPAWFGIGMRVDPSEESLVAWVLACSVSATYR